MYNTNEGTQEKRKEKHAETHISTKFNGIWVSSCLHSPLDPMYFFNGVFKSHIS
jgi:hypothetical protein